MVTVEARRLPLAHPFVRPTAEAGQDVLHGQLRLHWTLIVSSEITRLQKISESNPAVARWSGGAFEPAADPIRAAGHEVHTPPSVRRRESRPSRLGGLQKVLRTSVTGLGTFGMCSLLNSRGVCR